MRVVGIGLGVVSAVAAHGAALLWELPVRFNEFRGLPGGFESSGPTLVLQDRSGTGDSTRQYDILSPGAAAGTMVQGQDGVSDLSIRSRVIDGSEGRWQTVQLERQNSQLQAQASTAASTSRSGDSAVMAYEISFAPSLTITADRLAVDMSRINGRGDLYEWAFVTVGGIEDAPFDPADVARYTARDYNVVPAGVTPGPGGSAAPFANGRPISSFLTGDTRTTAANGLVQTGWWAAEGFNVAVTGAAEAVGNPRPAVGKPEPSATVTGADLGLQPDAIVQRFTVWFGFNDVAFDTDGDGFTRSAGSQTGIMDSLRIGASGPVVVPVPEPSLAALLAFSVAVILSRARFRQSRNRSLFR